VYKRQAVILIAILSVIVLIIGKNNSSQPEVSNTNETIQLQEESNEAKIEHPTVNAIALEEYLELFTHEFPTKVYLTRAPEGVPSLVLNGESLNDKYILMKNGIILPPINGHAYSYRRAGNGTVWLMTFKVGQYGGASDIFLNVINENLDSLAGTYLLSNTFGEDGYFSYQNGEFMNDSTFQYQKVWNNEDDKTDSLSGMHIIR
jgi:hypothetical protein